jgi:hypothetical protein
MSRRSWMLSLAVVVGLSVLASGLWRRGGFGDRSTFAQEQQEKQDPTKKKAGQARQNAGRQRAQLTDGVPAEVLSGAALLSNGDSYDDFVSVAQAADGTRYAAYLAYYDAHDQIRVHRQLPGGAWSTRTHVPLVQARADIWMPQIAVDAQQRLWVIWSEQTDHTLTNSGNWDLYARALENDMWGPLVRLTSDPRPDINPHVTVDAQRNIHVVWQAHPRNYGNIQYCRFDGANWSEPLAVTSGATSDWYPQVAVDPQGTAWIAFDSYRRGDYDVLLASVRDGKASDAIPIAQSDFYEAHASVACGSDGRVWVAWEEGGFNWGKDQGYWLRVTNRNNGSTLGSSRTVKVAAYADGKILAAPAIAPAASEGALPTTASPSLATDRDGRLWLRFRHLFRGQAQGRRVTRYWTENLTSLSRGGWSTAATLPASEGRISVFSRLIADQDGGVLVGYSADGRGPSNYHQPVHDRALVMQVAAPQTAAGEPALTESLPPQPPADMSPWNTAREKQQVLAARKHRTDINGQRMGIVRGDLHRHTELSWDVGPGNDGSYLDFYRYMIDVAAMDFGGLTDHQGGGHYAYHWWLTEKSADMYHLAPRFVPLYGYERSVRFPHGHRNVFHSYRGVPVFPFQLKLTQTGVFPGVGTGEVLDNDTKLLYEYLRKTQGVAISHTSGTSTMGTDWRDNDPEVEPVVEIYQGARNSYEVVGGPRVHDIAKQAAADAPGGYQEEGMVWNALAKGYRLGITASSDHGSTHISYSAVYTPSNDRQSILNAIRARRTYGSTDNVILEVWANGHFMGEEFETNEHPGLTLRVVGTAAVARIDLVRNGQYIYTSVADRPDVELTYVDREPAAGLNHYYFRIEQEDGEIAWASPVWIHFHKAGG